MLNIFKRVALCTCFVLAAGFFPAFAQSTQAHTNVVLIFADDLGTLDLNCYGSKDLHTPHLDALAARGVRFTQFYAAAPVCSPSRAALLTGRYPQRAGVPRNVGLHATGLPSAQVTIAELLKPVGYRTALVGKWHLGHVERYGPLDQGFDMFFGHKFGCIDNYPHFFYWSGPDVHDLWRGKEEHWEQGVYFGDLVVGEACRFIREKQHEPFFLFIPLNIPHYPLQGQEKFRRLYETLPEPRASYAALVSTMDEKVGEVLDMLDAHSLREKTLVIFMSDHGHSTEESSLFGGGNAGTYRGAKFSLFEGGIRVPAIVSLPGRFPQGEERGQLANAIDWLPTIAEVCGVEVDGASIDGKSLVGVIESADSPSPHGVMHWQTSGPNEAQWAVREGDWKLVFNARDTQGQTVPERETVFLSNLAGDARERVNLADLHPDIVKRLTRLHFAWVEQLSSSR